MYYSEIISLLKENPKSTAKRECWNDAYVMYIQSFDEIKYFRTQYIDNCIISTAYIFIPSQSDVIKDDWIFKPGE